MASSKGGPKDGSPESKAKRRGAGLEERPGAKSDGPMSPAEAAEDEDMRDLFLSEENLIRLAIGHLGGRPPPRKGNASRYKAQRSTSYKPSGPAQPARVRKALAKKLQRELTSRSWTPSELSDVCRLSITDCRALLSGQTVFTEETAQELSKALATSKEYWLTDRED